MNRPSTSRPHPAKRVSNACLQCRSRHMKCDSSTPSCSRCQQEKTPCVYLKSRRGGVRRRGANSQQPRYLSPLSSCPERPPQQQPPDIVSTSEPLTIGPILEHTDPRAMPSNTRRELPDNAQGLGESVQEGLLSLYYSFFHAAHPCVLPQWSLRLRAVLHPDCMDTLLPLLQFIGSLYSSAIASEPLEKKVLENFERIRARSATPSPFSIQAVVLYSIVVYWRDEIERSLELLDEAIRNAVQIGMHQEEFAAQNGEGDPVLEESWRRTWWQIYLTASHMSGSTHSFPSKVEGINMTTRLPCEEEYYESGNIPPSQTLYEYNMREFRTEQDQGFSSFAELIGLAHSLDLVLMERNQASADVTSRVCANLDTCILAWLLLLPPRKQVLIRDNGTVDEQIFRAHMLIYTYTADVNRELSEILFTTIESVSRRAPRPPRSQEARWGPLKSKTKLHTKKVLTAIENMNGLLTLPTHLALHSPFIICMIANTAISHLAAFKWVYFGNQLQIERERIRMIISVLRMLSEYWPLGKRTYREITTIARHVLQIEEQKDHRMNPGASTVASADGGFNESMRDFFTTAAAFSLTEADSEDLTP